MTLQDTIKEYLTYKRALGMRLESEGRILTRFCRSMNNVDIADVSPAAVSAFIAGHGPVTLNWKQNASVLRSFYRYAVGRGLVSSSPLPAFSPRYPETRMPHIYSADEINTLLKATDVLATTHSPLRSVSFRTLLLLLYGTGLRIGEALSLTLADVDLSEQIITVRDTKFFKTRLVPIGIKLADALTKYAYRRCQEIPMPLGDGSSFLAITRSGACANVVTAENLFSIVRKTAGLQREIDVQSQPRLHDFRHTMVIHHILAWYRSGSDVQRLLPQLATYLGHVDISSTQHYLRMTPELLQEANKRFARYAKPESTYARQ